MSNSFNENENETAFSQTMMTDTSLMQEKSAAQRQREHVQRMMVKNNRKKVAPGNVRQRNDNRASPDPTRRINSHTMTDCKGGNKRGMFQKGTYESPLKKFVRQNEGNVLSSGDSGSNLGSIGDREIIKPVIGGHGHGAGKTQFDDSVDKLNDGYQSSGMHQFMDEVETEQKFSQIPMT